MRNKYLEESNSEFEKEPPVRVTEEILKNPLIANVLEITCVSVPGGSYFVYEYGMPFRFWISFEDSNRKPVEPDKDRYRQRNIVERLIGRLKEYRCVFACYEKTAINLGGMIKIAFIQRHLKTRVPKV